MRFTLMFPVCAATLMLAGGALGAELRVDVPDADPASGALYVALFDSEQSFRARDSSHGAVARDGTPSVVFTSLPPGPYAVAVFQDLNGNGKLDLNLMGVPTEPYGFSRNVTGDMGPPAFQDAAVELTGGSQTEVIELRSGS